MTQETLLEGWGRWPKRRCRVERLDPATAHEHAQALKAGAIARGMGRSYGDASMHPPLTLDALDRNRFIEFDDETGLLVAEAGVTLAEIIQTFLPKGWFPMVTPGTKFVTLGGAVAGDVHGKNHHRVGSFGDHVAWFDLLCADGKVRRCSTQSNQDLFLATIGGAGLTGHLLVVACHLKKVPSAWIRQRTLPAENLDAAIRSFEANHDATYSVAWIDCLARGDQLGRSLVLLGEHAEPEELDVKHRPNPFSVPVRRKKTMPLDAPSWSLNRWSLRAFNALYYRKGSAPPLDRVIDYDRYFYPLDAILRWNRLYGARGFSQYQTAIPLENARDALAEQLELIAQSGLGSFLAVLKRFGPGSPQRPLSFPIEGYTLALDFPLSSAALTLMDQLDEITVAAGGRTYLMKDSRMSQKTFEAGYGDAVDAFRALRSDIGADRMFASLMSRRLGL
ncbi:MAG: FAD-binding oxidoreductase [Pseudomonadota bacterium]